MCIQIRLISVLKLTANCHCSHCIRNILVWSFLIFLIVSPLLLPLFHPPPKKLIIVEPKSLKEKWILHGFPVTHYY